MTDSQDLADGAAEDMRDEEELGRVRAQVAALAKLLDDQVRDMAELAAVAKSNGDLLADLATRLAAFMGTTRATLQLLAERVDEVAADADRALRRPRTPRPGDPELN